MEEVFKDVPNYEGHYQVSNIGRVKSLERVVKHHSEGLQIVKEKILKETAANNGYFMVSLYKNNKKRKYVTIHKLVAMAFLSHIPNGYKIVVDHIDHDKANNRVENLRLVTQRQNVSHRKIEGTSKYTGVCWNKSRNKWKSAIRIKGKVKYLGYFEDEHEAHLAYQKELTIIKSNKMK